MKKLAAITLTSMMLFLATAMVVGAVPSVEVRGAVAGTINDQSNLVDNTFTWNPQNFAGFFYDIKKDLGTETLKFTLTEGNKLSGDSPYGILYTTTAQNKAFERDLWGSYKIIGLVPRSSSPDTTRVLMKRPDPTSSTLSPPTRTRYPASRLKRS
jgi:hypothetical protein